MKDEHASQKPATSSNPLADTVKALAQRIDQNPNVKAALLEAIKRGKARAKGH